MAFIAPVNSNTRATQQVRPQQVASSTLALASLCPGSISPPLAISAQNGLVSECPSCVSGELPTNLREISPKLNSIEKGVKAGTCT